MTFTTSLLPRNRLARVRLAQHTTMRVGGEADLVLLDDRQDLAEALDAPHRWLGKGANLLVGDAGVDETVIKLGPAFAGLELGAPRGGRATVVAGAGLDLAEL